METMMTDAVRTTDLALATTLRVHGYLPTRLELNEAGHAVWVYESADGLADLVEDYHAGMSEVEPRQYNSMLARTRGELFTFLRQRGIEPPKSARRSK